MPEGKPPTPLEDDADECLHCAIVDMVDERIAAGGADAANLAALIAESLVDVILRVPEEEQAKLMAHTLAAWATLFFRKAVRTKAAPDRRTKGVMFGKRWASTRRWSGTTDKARKQSDSRLRITRC